MEDLTHRQRRPLPGAPGEALSQEDVDARVAASREAIRDICRRGQMGLITEEEAMRLLLQVFHRDFSEFLKSRSLRCSVTPDSWALFLRDRRRWERGEPPEADEGVSWLSFRPRALPPAEGDAPGVPASPMDKARFFELAAAFSLPAAYFAPLPAGTPSPQIVFNPASSEGTVGCGLWAGGGGLLTGGDPLGTTAVLVDSQGLRAEILVTGRDGGVLTGAGTLEGYTSQRRRPVRIHLSEGRIFALSAVLGPDDREAFRAFPLWRDFFAHRDRADALLKESLKTLYARLLSP